MLNKKQIIMKTKILTLITTFTIVLGYSQNKPYNPEKDKQVLINLSSYQIVEGYIDIYGEYYLVINNKIQELGHMTEYTYGDNQYRVFEADNGKYYYYSYSKSEISNKLMCLNRYRLIFKKKIIYKKL